VHEINHEEGVVERLKAAGGTAAGRVAIEMFSHQYNERSMVHSNLVHIMHHIEYTVTI